MKILQTPARFYPYIGGVENYAYYLSRELVRLGHQVRVVCADEPDTGNDDIEGIGIKRLKYITKIANTNLTLNFPYTIWKEDFDIIHTYLPCPWSADWSGYISCLKKKPFVFTYQNDIIGRNILSLVAKSYNFSFLPMLAKLTSKIIITTKKYLDYSPYLKRYIKKIEVIPIGVHIESFMPKKQENHSFKTIGFLGIMDEFHRYKGLDYLIRAMVEIKKREPEAKLLIGGEGILQEEYKGLAENLGLTGHIEFLGRLSFNQLLEFYNNCDVFVLPSISAAQEGFGMVLLEAMASGKPVVTTDITGPADRIKEKNAGIVVEPKNVNQLSDAISTILKNRNSANEMGGNARRLVEEEYSWKVIVKKIEKLYISC